MTLASWASATTAAARRVGASARGRQSATPVAREVRRRLRLWLRPTLPDSPPHPLSPRARGVLFAVAETLLDGLAPPEPYLASLELAAQSETGVATVYEAFALQLDSAARSRYGSDFAGCTPVQRLALLPRPPATQQRGVRRRLTAAARRLLRPQEVTGHTYVVQPLLRLFAETDAWLVMGYASHPGAPRRLGDGPATTEAPR